LQGGGALGSYQAGAYQALCHHDFEPEWLPASRSAPSTPRSSPVTRAKNGWGASRNSGDGLVPGLVESGCERRPRAVVVQRNQRRFDRHLRRSRFFTPRIPPAPLWPQGSPQSQSYYDTRRLKNTGAPGRLRPHHDLQCRLSVGAVSVTTGNFKYFDNSIQAAGKKIGPEHIMASGALPPGFPSSK